MSGSINKVILVGNVGKEPEVKMTQNGSKLAVFSLATTESWKDKNSGERVDRTEWHRIVVYQPNLVSIIEQYVKKGSRLYLEGALQTRKWVDQQGIEKYTTEIILQGFNATMVLLDSKRADEGSNDNFSSQTNSNSMVRNVQSNNNYNAVKEYELEDLNDDVPF